MHSDSIPLLDPIVCAPWCEDGDGHPKAGQRADQTCWGAADYTTLVIEPSSVEGGRRYDSRIGVMARRMFRRLPEVYVHLDLVRGDHDIDVCLTAPEARRIAAALVSAATTIEGA